MSTPRSDYSDDSTDSVMPELEFKSVAQVEELYDTLIDKYNEVMMLLETYEIVDDDIQELREKTLDKYEHMALAEAYDAVGEHTTAEGCRNQGDECDERIEELQEGLDGTDIETHFYEMYKVEIKKETYEIMLKACEKYLEKSKKKKVVQEKRQTIRPASPRRYPKGAASPSRLLNNTPPRKQDTPKAAPPKLEPPKIEIPKIDPPKEAPKVDLTPSGLPLLKVDIKGPALPLPNLAGLSTTKRGRKPKA